MFGVKYDQDMYYSMFNVYIISVEELSKTDALS